MRSGEGLEERVRAAFRDRFGGASPIVVRAPGRVNLVGEHTDYNDGFVLPMAIDRALWIALRPREDRQVEVTSLDLGDVAAFSLDEIRHDDAGWGEYVKGVAWALGQRGYPLCGWEGIMAGDVPIGAGLSSSAALELAAARAFQAVGSWGWDPKAMALAGQVAENKWVGMNCGIMDQMISAKGKAGHALLIDCRSLETESVPLPRGTAVVVLDTTTRRGLVDSAYNERRAQCEAAARFFGVPALRDVDEPTFAVRSAGLARVTRRRARHVIMENARTLASAEAMRQGDAVRLGILMDASHESLRDDFEVSTDALDAIVQCARGHEACFGARMTGAGFGGCAVALVEAEWAGSFAGHVQSCYRAETGQTATIYICQPSDGAAVV